jgi:hypothetical protein
MIEIIIVGDLKFIYQKNLKILIDKKIGANLD